MPKGEEAQTVAFPQAPWPHEGLLQCKAVIREDDGKDGKKAYLAALLKADLAQSPGTSVCP